MICLVGDESVIQSCSQMILLLPRDKTLEANLSAVMHLILGRLIHLIIKTAGASDDLDRVA